MKAIAPQQRKWAELISAAWRQSAESFITAGQLLAKAKADLPHGDWLDMIDQHLPFRPRTAQMLIAIAEDNRLTNAKHAALLPPHWTTMYELTKLDDEQFDARIEDGTIRADMERKDISQQIKTQKRATRERELGTKQRALPKAKFGIILADPEWPFEPWSRVTGMDRAADNHYPTSCLEVIASRPVESIAADDAVLFLWATVPMLPQAIIVMGAWGFDYKSSFVWTKDKIGTGYWNRNQHEYCLLGARGKPPAPAPGALKSSVIEAPVREHSRKPDDLLEYIDGWYPTLPKIELNRRGPARKGWAAWGNESAPLVRDKQTKIAELVR